MYLIMKDWILFSENTNPILSIFGAYADFRNPVQQFEKLSSSGFCFSIIWSEGGSSAQCCPTDDYR